MADDRPSLIRQTLRQERPRDVFDEIADELNDVAADKERPDATGIAAAFREKLAVTAQDYALLVSLVGLALGEGGDGQIPHDASDRSHALLTSINRLALGEVRRGVVRRAINEEARPRPTIVDDGDTIELSSGRRIYSYAAALAIGKTYDTREWPTAYAIDADPGGVTDLRKLDEMAAGDGPLTQEERDELAAWMITAWREWASGR